MPIFSVEAVKHLSNRSKLDINFHLMFLLHSFSSLWLNGIALAILGIGVGPLCVPALSDMNLSAKYVSYACFLKVLLFNKLQFSFL